MIRLENLIQFIVPLTFLAIWAITSLFNREAQPPPPRTGRPPRPNGWETANPSAARSPRAAGPVPREAHPSRTQGGLRGSTDDILVIEGDPNLPYNPGRGRPGRANRMGASAKSRSRRPNPDPGERAPVVRKSQIEGVTSHIDGSSLVQSEALHPIHLSHQLDIKGTLLTLTSPGDHDATRTVTPSAFGITLNQENLRRNFLIAEVLFRPPVGLRGQGLPRSGRAPEPLFPPVEP